MEDRLFFIQNLVLMLRAGITLPKALGILAKQTKNIYWRDVILDVRESSMKGNTLEKSLSKFPNVFPHSFISMVRMGELKGDLSSVLDKYFEFLQSEQKVRDKVKSAMIYPIVILVAIVAVAIFAVVFIFPKITELFNEVEGTLPLTTRIVMGISNILVKHGILIAFLLVGLIVFLIFFVRTKRGKFIYHFILLRLPIIGPIVIKKNLFHVLRNFGVLLEAGIPLAQSLSETSEIISNVFYKQSLKDISVDISKGNQINEGFKKYPLLYPEVALQIITVGEESGKLTDMLRHISTFYEQKLLSTLDNLSSIIEPVLILLMGAGVAFMAVSILMPIYSFSTMV